MRYCTQVEEPVVEVTCADLVDVTTPWLTVTCGFKVSVKFPWQSEARAATHRRLDSTSGRESSGSFCAVRECLCRRASRLHRRHRRSLGDGGSHGGRSRSLFA